MWGNQSGDAALAGAFKAGQLLRQKWIQNPTKEVADELKQKGDIHIQNYYRFHKIWIDKQRDAQKRNNLKAVVFGAIYGKSAATLGKDLKKERLDGLANTKRELMKQIRALKS
jgi:DNA polymerase I-like protein with 3'-5' exonuclease and polymerase domains